MSHRSTSECEQSGLASLARAFVCAEYVEEEGRRRPIGVKECPVGEGCQIGPHSTRERKTGPDFGLRIFKCSVHDRYFTVYPPGYVPYARQRIAPVTEGGAAIVPVNEDESGIRSDAELKQLWRGCLPGGGPGCRAGPSLAA